MKSLALFAALLIGAAAQAQNYTVLCMKTPCGQLKLSETQGRMAVDYSYRDNGRGPDQKEVMEFAPDGSWLGYRTEGVSTFGARIDEQFERRADGVAVWWRRMDMGGWRHEGRSKTSSGRRCKLGCLRVSHVGGGHEQGLVVAGQDREMVVDQTGEQAGKQRGQESQTELFDVLRAVVSPGSDTKARPHAA